MSSKDRQSYSKCLAKAKERYDKGELKLCPRGYCTAKHKFEVYPSAYANGYAVQVCQGSKPDYVGEEKADPTYVDRVQQLQDEADGLSDLQRWYEESWVNVCEKGEGPGGYAVCGTGKGVDDPENYPYCRPYYRLPGTPVVTAQELTDEEITMMCEKKRSLPQGVRGKPTRVVLPKSIRATRQGGKMRGQENRSANQKGGKGGERDDMKVSLPIPREVREAAKTGLKLLQAGFEGGTQTGWDRGRQLAEDQTIDVGSLADMRTWFARHGPDARHGGTSYPGYCKWLEMGSPEDPEKSGVDKGDFRGAVSWLIWGGDRAYTWLKTPQIRTLLKQAFPNRKQASPENNLGCDVR